MKEDSLRIKKMRAKIIEKEYIQVLDQTVFDVYITSGIFSFVNIFPLSLKPLWVILFISCNQNDPK